ncbi:bifunctional coenzyme A synthase isoform X2 [Hyposmocoma kahamanoa]|uniref:bifunctional coenzyme A synthase isoform X2 n=1 Tax=Hyposmocoma kahamanoa TaxID=1477025 RepID=UPI000E6D7804|nr:bifunctional coenzyme A synthase isoform X2 [Hyposmocoma kahamanoa]
MFKIVLGVPLTVLVLSVVLPWFFVMNPPSAEMPMANSGLIFVSSAAKVHNVCQKVSRLVQKVLYIKINSSSETALSLISRQIAQVYSKATHYCNNLDVRLMLKPNEPMKNLKTSQPIDLILYDSELTKDIDKLKHTVVTLSSDYKLHYLGTSLESIGEDVANDQQPVKQYEYVALGGTFDRLHNGHKILLSQAVLRSTKHLTVGVTDVNMIQSKKLWELIEPVEKRIAAVLEFVIDINPDLEYCVLPIQDIYGPTKDDPKYQMLVVSEETIKGGVKVNEKRVENGIPKLDTYVIGLATDAQQSAEEETKVSSSNQRMRLLGTILRPPVPNPKIPEWPYVIGLAGGIASGKSNIAEKLNAKGAAIVNCDFIAHDLYKPGLPLNQTIAETFGTHVIAENGDVDRKKLGSIVFGDKEQLEKLNQILWPAILEEAQRRIRALGEQGFRVVVMEAAVVVRAHWYNYCHQLWSVIIPPNEAIKRLQKRNNLTEEEARHRLEAQPTNLEQVAHANVVFSPFWSYEYTQQQVDKAWDNLQQYLNERKGDTAKL